MNKVSDIQKVNKLSNLIYKNSDKFEHALIK